MQFLSEKPHLSFRHPLLAVVLANTMLSTVPGISGAGPTPEKTLLTPNLDSELVATGAITSLPVKPDTPTGCPTPSTITRSMAALTGLVPAFVNGGLVHAPSVPCIDVYGEPGADPRFSNAVPRARELYSRGRLAGEFFSAYSDLLVLGECVPGGTTTALCVLRALGIDARVSSSFADNPHSKKDDVCTAVLERIGSVPSDPLDVVRAAGDPMIAVAAGICASYRGTVILAGGTQMLAVAAVLKGLGMPMPDLATTAYVRDDASASFTATCADVGAHAYYVDPDFGDLGHAGLARYCIGEVKEGMGAGGAMFLASLMGHPPAAITGAILDFIRGYA
ncbi:MAG: TIGR00303 family protein [Methanomicrobiaceae archaeon]|nr:TIGR00303 family protein [Methanomicrobiaceae archaeon]